MSANHIESLAKALYENGNPQHTAEDRAMLGPFEELDLLQQTIWIDLANAAHNHIGEQKAEIAELEERIANAQSILRETGRYNAARTKHWNIRVFACDVLAALKGRAGSEGA